MGWAGTLLATIVIVLLMHLFSQAQFFQQGWRVAYLIGGILGCVILVFRAFISESIEFEQSRLQAKQRHAPTIEPISLKKMLLQYWPTMLVIGGGLLSTFSTVAKFIDTYFPQYIRILSI